MKTTQRDRVLNYIRQYGSITSFEAYTELGITQLGARIDGLQKEGYQFQKEWITNKNRFGEDITYKKYSLVDDVISENQQHITV